ncbi:RNA polymerase sigma-70 factor [Balneolales bacterium ANBcel1]|nr:RNA polymerase sigma-70 factor [Balneolales bacterium ANBcel1]
MSVKKGKESDRLLAEKIRRGDRKAFTDLYRAYFSELCCFAHRYVESPDIAEEMVQDVFMNIWNRRSEWHIGIHPAAYLYRSVRNRSLDYLKHRNVVLRWEKTAMHETAQSAPSPDLLYEHDELADAVSKAIAKLPERRRTIFVLSRDHELTYREIAEVLDISVKTVETQMGRALKMLRDLMKKHNS